MSDYSLTAEPRDLIGKKVNKVRLQGKVPGVLYGRGVDPVSLQFDERELQKVLDEAGTSNLITLQVGATGKKFPVLLRDTQIDVLRHNLQHVDFLHVAMDEVLTTDVSVSLVGEVDTEGFVIQDVNSLTISCLPGDLPSVIEADISRLVELEGTLTLDNLGLPETLTVHADSELVLVHIEYPSLLEEEEEVEEDEFGVVGLVSDDEKEEDWED